MPKLVPAALALLLLVPAASARETGGSVALKSREIETESRGVKIALYEKWNPVEAKNWKQNGKVVLLVHGATWSTRCTFDPVDGYSMMDALAEQGFDVWALDLHGYGHSGESGRDWTPSTSAADDVEAAADYVRSLRWVEKVHVVGYQWGSQAAALFAERKPNKVARLVLFGMRYRLVDKKKPPEDPYRENGLANAMLRPEDGDVDPDLARARAQVCLEYDHKSPNGALLDLLKPSPVDPAKVKVPTLLLMGERETDPTVLADRLDFFAALGARTKALSVLAGLGKYASFEKGHGRLVAAIAGFLEGR